MYVALLNRSCHLNSGDIKRKTFGYHQPDCLFYVLVDGALGPIVIEHERERMWLLLQQVGN